MAVQQAGKALSKAKGKARSEVRKTNSLPTALADLPKAGARFIDPMKPRLVEAPPTVGNWAYEIKFDGIRVLAVKKGRKVSLLSRNRNELAKRFPDIVRAVLDLKIGECVLDGEIVALDEKGRSSFQLLQGLEMEGRKAPVLYYIFDLLQAEGRNFLNVPLEKRKEWLARFLRGSKDPIRLSADIGGDARLLLDQVKRIGLEGIIGKRRQSIYEPGRRSGAWIKLKCLNEQEFVIGGYTPPAGSRKYFGAILVGYYEKSGLRFAGKVGTGFDGKTLSSLYRQFQKEKRQGCPFVDLPYKQGSAWAQALSPGEMKKCVWINPVFVAQVKFSEWTRDGKLRQPVYLGLREDKKAQDVGREG
jgi:bifunctional non-homologous end joining protein LigD